MVVIDHPPDERRIGADLFEKKGVDCVWRDGARIVALTSAATAEKMTPHAPLGMRTGRAKRIRHRRERCARDQFAEGTLILNHRLFENARWGVPRMAMRER